MSPEKRHPPPLWVTPAPHHPCSKNFFLTPNPKLSYFSLKPFPLFPLQQALLNRVYPLPSHSPSNTPSPPRLPARPAASHRAVQAAASLLPQRSPAVGLCRPQAEPTTPPPPPRPLQPLSRPLPGAAEPPESGHHASAWLAQHSQDGGAGRKERGGAAAALNSGASAGLPALRLTESVRRAARCLPARGGEWLLLKDNR